ncbi:unnamed protein product [Discula destructiva]
MEGMMWGVAAMVVKDAVKTPYLKSRDYERNVRQVYRDVDNLRITMDQVKLNCQGEDLENGPHTAYIKRSERQLKDAYRTLRKSYPRTMSLAKLLDYAATPGAEMHLLDIGKEANQTARGLGDLLSEIRFAKIGKSKEEPASAAQGIDGASPPSASSLYDMTRYESAVSDGSSSPRSSVSDRDSPLDRAIIRTSIVYTPASSTSSRSRKHSSSSSRRSRSHSTTETVTKALASPSHSKGQRLDVILESGAEREHALDNLQIGIDKCLAAPDEEHESEAMEYMEHALAEVLRLQKTKGFSGSQFDEGLGDAVEDLDDSMNSLLRAKSQKEKKYAMKRLSHALEDVDHALAERQKHKARSSEHSPRQLSGEPIQKALPTYSGRPTRGSLRRHNTSDGSRNRRYSMYK